MTSFTELVGHTSMELLDELPKILSLDIERYTLRKYIITPALEEESSVPPEKRNNIYWQYAMVVFLDAL